MPVSSPDAAELVKLLENIFRSVNIALVNELAQLCDRMGVDVWEVVEAAATKPFGFMSFKPGPGLGGHCLPVDPFYLSWKAREFDFYTEFIELAGKINENMPYFCFQKIARALNAQEPRAQGQPCPSRSGSRTRRRRRRAGVSRAQADGAAAEGGAEVGYTTPTCRSSPRSGSASEDLDAALSTRRLRRDRHRARRRSTTRRSPSARASSSTFATRPGRTAAAAGRCGSCERGVGQVGLGRWGANLARNFAELAELSWLCDADAARVERPTRRASPAQLTERFEDVLADAGRRGGRDRDAGRHARGARAAGARRRQARVRREADGARVERGRGARRAGGGARARADARPSPPLPPGRREAEGARRLGRARGGPLRLRQPPEPRHDPPGRERALEPRRSRPLGDPAPRSARSRASCGRAGSPSSRTASRTSSSATCASRPERWRTCTSPGSTRTRCGG